MPSTAPPPLTQAPQSLSRRPAPPLDAHIALLWTAARPAGLAHAREWNLPGGVVDLVLPLDRPAVTRFDHAQDRQGRPLQGGVLQGPGLLPTLRCTATASVVVGAQFRPAGWMAAWAAPAEAIAHPSLALDDLWPGWAERVRDRVHAAGALHQPAQRLALFEAALRTQLLRGSAGRGAAGLAAAHTSGPGPTPAAALAAWAWQRLAAGATVGTVQRASGLGPAGFVRQFRAGCGLAPQQVRGLQRFRQALQLAHGQGLAWAEVAAEAGYTDQAHLVRAFQRHAGTTPGAWQRASAATGHAQHMALPDRR